jgi:hypothetical protein
MNQFFYEKHAILFKEGKEANSGNLNFDAHTLPAGEGTGSFLLFLTQISH